MKHTPRAHVAGLFGFVGACLVGWVAIQIVDRLVSAPLLPSASSAATCADMILLEQPPALGRRSERLGLLCTALADDDRKWRFNQAFCSVGPLSAEETAVVCGDWQRMTVREAARPPAANFFAHELRTVSAASAFIAYCDGRLDDEDRRTARRYHIGDEGLVLATTGSGSTTVIFRKGNILVYISGGRRNDVEELAKLAASHLP
jgi:hypothetical protein